LLGYLLQPSRKIQDLFVLWATLQAKGLIPIVNLLQQQDLKNFMQMGLEEREYLNLVGHAYTQNRSSI